jgi:hypothetical protein
MKRCVRLKDEVGLAGNPEAVAVQVVGKKSGACLVVRLIFDALLYLRGRI